MYFMTSNLTFENMNESLLLFIAYRMGLFEGQYGSHVKERVSSIQNGREIKKIPIF